MDVTSTHGKRAARYLHIVSALSVGRCVVKTDTPLESYLLHTDWRTTLLCEALALNRDDGRTPTIERVRQQRAHWNRRYVAKMRTSFDRLYNRLRRDGRGRLPRFCQFGEHGQAWPNANVCCELYGACATATALREDGTDWDAQMVLALESAMLSHDGVTSLLSNVAKMAHRCANRADGKCPLTALLMSNDAYNQIRFGRIGWRTITLPDTQTCEDAASRCRVVVSHEQIAIPQRDGELRQLAVALRMDTAALPKGLHVHFGCGLEKERVIDSAMLKAVTVWHALRENVNVKQLAAMRYMSKRVDIEDGDARVRFVLGNLRLRACDGRTLLALSRDGATIHLELDSCNSAAKRDLPGLPVDLIVRIFDSATDSTLRVDLCYRNLICAACERECGAAAALRVRDYLCLQLLPALQRTRARGVMRWCTPCHTKNRVRMTTDGVDEMKTLAADLTQDVRSHVRARTFAQLFSGDEMQIRIEL